MAVESSPLEDPAGRRAGIVLTGVEGSVSRRARADRRPWRIKLGV
jgi:hypothetical protein